MQTNNRHLKTHGSTTFSTHGTKLNKLAQNLFMEFCERITA